MPGTPTMPAERSPTSGILPVTASAPGYLTLIKIIPRPPGVGRKKLETVLEKLGWDQELHDFVRVRSYHHKGLHSPVINKNSECDQTYCGRAPRSSSLRIG